MSATVPAPRPPKSKKDKERKLSQPQPSERLKTVVRRLPPNLPEEIFWQSVQAWVTEDTAVWKIFYPGKLRKKLNKENIPSRAYIAFKNEEQLALFSREYDGHIFRDKTGVESQAVVEFAPYPKIPSEKRKPDNRNATIEKDEDFISFLESLKASENVEPVSLESLIASTQPPPPPKTTPLLEALKAEKSATKDKEAILRNHPHYQISANTSRKDDKKKVPPAQAASRPGENAPVNNAAGGKKGGKKGTAPPASQPATLVQGAKAAANNASGSTQKGPPNMVTGGSAQGPKPPKAPRPPRQPKTAVSQPSAAAGAVASVQVVPNPTIVTALPSTGPSTLLAPGSPAPQAQPSSAGGRRTRPVIGIASRQFEAALSGVAGLASAATERKRLAREREAALQSPTGAGGTAASGAASVPETSLGKTDGAAASGGSSLGAQYARIDGSDTEKEKAGGPVPPPSPRRNRRGGNRGGGGGAGSGSGRGDNGPAANPHPAGEVANQVKVPSILQRNDGPPPVIMQRDAPSPAPLTAASPSVHQPIAGGGGNPPRGGRRGRGGGGGGGRGRGGPPAGPRGGG